jgi:hypothetical protein
MGALSIGDGAGARWAILVLAALAIAVGAVSLLRRSAAGPGARTPLERTWTALPLVLLAALIVLSALAI